MSPLVANSLLATGRRAGNPANVPGMARPSLKALFQNFGDYDGPLDRKIAKAFRNNAKKVVTFSDCCGHPGEPGC